MSDRQKHLGRSSNCILGCSPEGLHPGGMPAISRWLSEATPPVGDGPNLTTPEGVAAIRRIGEVASDDRSHHCHLVNTILELSRHRRAVNIGAATPPGSLTCRHRQPVVSLRSTTG